MPAIKLDSEPLEFDVGGTIFALPLVQARKRMDEIAAAEKEPFEYLQKFVEWVNDEFNVLLTLDQADQVWEHVQIRWAEKKNQHVERLKSIAK